MAHSADSKSLASLAPRAHYLHFSDTEAVPETQLHLDLRTLLYQLLSEHLGESHTAGSLQAVYFDASDPSRCLAPDVYVKCAPRGESMQPWNVWEHGAPDVAVELTSDNDSLALDWDVKLSDYNTLGVRELVQLDLVTRSAPRLRVWNLVEGDLQERDIEGDVAPSLVLNLIWTIAGAQGMPAALRIAQATDPTALIPTAEEAQKIEAEARQVETQARKAAEARVAELEALLKQRG